MHLVVDKAQLDLKRKYTRYAGGALEPYGPDDVAVVSCYDM